MLGINIGQNNITSLMYLISRKVKVFIPGLIIALIHTPSIYNKLFCTFLEYFSYAGFYLIFTTLLGKWEKHYYSMEIKGNRLGNLHRSAQHGSKNYLPIQQKISKISRKYLDDEQSQQNVTCQGLYIFLYYIFFLEL